MENIGDGYRQKVLLYLSYKGQICHEREEKNKSDAFIYGYYITISCVLLDSDSPAAPHTNYTNIAVQIFPELDYANSCL